ncbi:MAG: hypothetical protein DRJ68_07090 [Thermoprotei archaeon]|nr:MAG: hypothetical protein DRJ62_02260 [Thermoprotei archaeon]RLF18071.1 MAG: hypothetical protein DRJ68_07090 [Thermoprotei archaeon]
MSIWEEDIKEVEEALRALDSLSKPDASKHWVRVEEWSVEHGDEFIGVDGSFTVRPLPYSTFYLARALAVSPSAGSARKSRSELVDSVNEDYVRQHVRAVMSMLEVQAASETFIEAVKQGVNPVVLFDGSLSSMLITHSPREPYIREITIESLSSLIEECEAIFIAKRSSSDLYEKGYPDMALFAFMPMGYSKPIAGKTSQMYHLTEDLLEPVGGSSKLKELTVFYAKLVEKGPLLKFEIPGVLSEGDVFKVLSRISCVSPSGYPVPLLVAHKRVKAGSALLKRVFSLMGFRALHGREMLREVFM